MKKFLIVIFTLVLMCSIFTVSSFAIESQTEFSENAIADETKAPNSEEPTKEDSGNFFELIYTELISHADEILSALAFIASLVIGLTYKKGLLPIIRGALNNMSNEIGEIKQSTEKSTLLSIEATDAATKKLECAQELVINLESKLESLESELARCVESEKERETTSKILLAQVDMLYEIFMSSSLPAYQKDAVGEKISEMKRALSKENGAI